MIILLPKDETKINQIEQELTAESFKGLLNSTRSKSLDVFIPKFTFNTFYSLKEDLKEMGMSKVFNETSANLSGISNEQLYVSFVLHKAFVAVDEEGTEAAAVTAIGIATTGIELRDTFRADHPFIFAIIQRSTDNILFLGKVMDPTQ